MEPGVFIGAQQNLDPESLAEIAESPVLHPLRMLGKVRVADAIETSHSHTGHGVIHRGRESVITRTRF